MEPLPLSLKDISYLFDHLLLFWTNIQRDASSVLSEQKENTASKMSVLQAMVSQVFEMQDLLSGPFSLEAFGAMLHEGWMMKQSLASKITNPKINEWYEKARDNGAYGGKLCGAGGGGFLLFLAPPKKHDSIRQHLHELQEEPIAFEPHGVRTIVKISRRPSFT
jgi:D-glycero-alpha-D-manno-heptose-7-phosphate kinase